MFRFTVEHYNETYDNKLITITSGIVASKNFISAMKKITDYFGTTLLNIKELYELENIIEDYEIKDMLKEN